jgi:hypothetical protein
MDNSVNEDLSGPVIKALETSYTNMMTVYEKLRWEVRKGNISLQRYQKYVDEKIIPQDLNFQIKKSNPYPEWMKDYKSLDDLKKLEDDILLQAKTQIVQLRYTQMNEALDLKREAVQFYTESNILDKILTDNNVESIPPNYIEILDRHVIGKRKEIDDLFKKLDDRYQERQSKKVAAAAVEADVAMDTEAPASPPQPNFDWTSANSDEKIEFLFTNTNTQFDEVNKNLQYVVRKLAEIQKNFKAPRDPGRSQPVQRKQQDNQKKRQSSQKINPQQSNNQRPKPTRSYSDVARQTSNSKKSSRPNNPQQRTVRYQDDKSENKVKKNPKNLAVNRGKPPPPSIPTEKDGWKEVSYKKRKKQQENNNIHQPVLDQKSRTNDNRRYNKKQDSRK